MSNEPLGIVEDAAKRRAMYGHFAYTAPVILSPAEKKIIIPEQPVADADSKPPSEPSPIEGLAEMRVKVTRALAQLAAIDRTIAQLQAQVGPQSPLVPAADVMAKFVEVAREVDYRIGTREYTPADLLARRREQTTSWSRHVCIDLVHRLSGVSLNVIGRAFGGLDHSTIHHAIRRAPEHLLRMPALATIHAKVLAAFETGQ